MHPLLSCGCSTGFYEPQHRCDVPLTWPRKPIAPEHAPALFEKLGTDALFFAFYFQQVWALALACSEDSLSRCALVNF